MLVNRDTAFLLWLIKCHSPGPLSTRESSALVALAVEPRHFPVRLPTWLCHTPQPPSGHPKGGLAWGCHGRGQGHPVVAPRHSSESHFQGTRLCSKSQRQMAGSRARSPECERLQRGLPFRGQLCKFGPNLSLSLNGTWESPCRRYWGLKASVCLSPRSFNKEQGNQGIHHPNQMLRECKGSC